MFDRVPGVAGDPILSLQEVYARDECPYKVNLSIGLYYDEVGRIPELSSVCIARERIQNRRQAGGYQPMAGAANYRRAVQALLFGADHPVIAAGRVATIQTLGGSGALKIGSDVLKDHFPIAEVWISDPSWDNHAGIFEGSGFRIRRYPYFNPDTGRVDFHSMTTCLASLPSQTVVLFHPCCHNPTGADLEQNNWDEIIEIVKDRQLIPFIDIAYQGYAKGIDEDRYLISALADAGVSFLVSNSFSKTFSLYGERCGGLSVVCASAEEAGRVLAQLERVVRRSYSSPPTYGGQIVASVLLDVELRSLWVSEVTAMRMRISEMRRTLHENLSSLRPDINFDYVLKQQGMFSFTGLTLEHVRALRADSGIYLIDSGRLCLTGLNPGNVVQVASALAQVLPS